MGSFSLLNWLVVAAVVLAMIYGLYLGVRRLAQKTPATLASSTRKTRDLADSINKFTFGMLRKNDEALAEAQRMLSSEGERLLEYFWSIKRKEIRYNVPLTVMEFFETEGVDGIVKEMGASELHSQLSALQDAGYIASIGRKSGEAFELTLLGVAYIKDKHPSFIVFWERLIERTPAIVSFFIGLVAFVAAVLGIYDVVSKSLGHQH